MIWRDIVLSANDINRKT